MIIRRQILSLSIVMVMLGLAMAACNAPGASTQASETPQMTAELPAATETAIVTEAAMLVGEAEELRPIPVQDVRVEISVGSPIPVEVQVAGEWPDLCAQLVEVNQTQSGDMFEIELLATPADPECPPDNLGLPFGIALPLNLVDMAQGSYTVAVNGVETNFDWVTAGEVPPVSTEMEGDARSLVVEDVRVEIGVGSPIPVVVQVDGEWNDPCANLAEVRQSVSGNQIDITLLATPAEASCLPANQGLPFRIAVPLNMVEMALGEYRVVVNGVESVFEWMATPGAPEAPAAAMTIAYIGSDGNLWVIENGNQPRQVTQDGTPLVYSFPPPDGTVSYYFPKVSSDGSFVAARRDAGTPVEWGMQFEISLWVYDLTSSEARLVYEKTPAGFDWKAGSHLLAYGLGVEQEYFTTRGGQPDAELATGIMGIDMDSGESSELVRPERGLALYSPTWSPDGRFLGFDELLYDEGRGPFAYYDFENNQYVAWDDPIGTYDFAPDGSHLAYDRLTYTASGEERIFLQPVSGGEESQLSPDMPGGYAYLPVFSPLGEHIVYLAALGGPDDPNQHLYVQELAGGELLDLGVFESVWNLSWTPDGNHLVFHAGPYGSQQVLMVSAADGAQTVLADGNSPDVSR